MHAQKPGVQGEAPRLPLAFPEGTANPWGWVQPQEPHGQGWQFLPFAKTWRDSARLVARFFHPRAPQEESPREKGVRCSLQTLTAPPPAHLPQPGSTGLRTVGEEFRERLRPAYLSVFCSPDENSSKVILQLQVPHRERAAYGLLLPPWACGRPLPALPHRLLQPSRRLAVRPSRPTPSPALGPSPHHWPRHLHGSCFTATEGQRPRSPELSYQPPANHLQPHLHTCSHWVMQISLLGQSDPSSRNQAVWKGEEPRGRQA